MSKNEVNRSAKDGEFVSEEEAKANPDTTVTEQKATKSDKDKSKKATKCYRTNISGLKIAVGDRNPEGQSDPDLLDHVQFVTRQIRYQGDNVKVGVLETDNAKVQAILASDANVVEIKKAEYDEIVGEA